MADLLDRIRAEIRDRLEESRAAVEESARLEATLAALDGAERATRPAPAAEPAAPKRRRARRSAATRAPRGQNRERVLSAVRDRPGVTAPELAKVSGVKAGTLYTLLRRLVEEGTLTKRELPGGDTGYLLTEQA